MVGRSPGCWRGVGGSFTRPLSRVKTNTVHVRNGNRSDLPRQKSPLPIPEKASAPACVAVQSTGLPVQNPDWPGHGSAAQFNKDLSLGDETVNPFWLRGIWVRARDKNKFAGMAK